MLRVTVSRVSAFAAAAPAVLRELAVLDDDRAVLRGDCHEQAVVLMVETLSVAVLATVMDARVK
ncbi:MAG: hypothetical protein EB117_16290 [Betaproteobacteria bacterium]|nr:hypothetical protein [Betaproteobacteria bacterium]